MRPWSLMSDQLYWKKDYRVIEIEVVAAPQ